MTGPQRAKIPEEIRGIGGEGPGMRICRTMLGARQSDVARVLRVTQGYVGSYEKGRRGVSADRMAEFARSFAVGTLCDHRTVVWVMCDPSGVPLRDDRGRAAAFLDPSDAADVCRAMCCTVGPVTAVPYHHCSLGDQIRLRARTPALAAWVGGYCSTFSPFRDTGRTE